MPKTNRTVSSHSSGTRASGTRDLRSLLHVPQHDLQSQLAGRLERLGFPALRPGHVQLLTAIGSTITGASEVGVRLSDLVAHVSLAKQTVGDLLDELATMRMVERFQDPDHGVIKRVRLGPKGKVWAAEVKRVSAATEAKWANRLGSKKMQNLRALLEELAATVESGDGSAPSAKRSQKSV